MIEPTKCPVHPQSDQSLLGAQWAAKDPMLLHVGNKDGSDCADMQTDQLFAGSIHHLSRHMAKPTKWPVHPANSDWPSTQSDKSLRCALNG